MSREKSLIAAYRRSEQKIKEQLEKAKELISYELYYNKSCPECQKRYRTARKWFDENQDAEEDLQPV